MATKHVMTGRGPYRNDGPDRKAENGSGPAKSTLREYFESICVAVILALFIRTFVVQAFKIPTGSMEQNLLIGDHLLVNKMLYAPVAAPLEDEILPIRDVRRGDVVVFKFPMEPERDFIKRVIGLPGDAKLSRAEGEKGGDIDAAHLDDRDMVVVGREAQSARVRIIELGPGLDSSAAHQRHDLVADTPLGQRDHQRLVSAHNSSSNSCSGLGGPSTRPAGAGPARSQPGCLCLQSPESSTG